MNRVQLVNDEMLKRLVEDGEIKDFIIIDVRESSEYEMEHIKEARLVPLAKLLSTNFSSDAEKPVIFHCRSGGRTKINENKLLKTGFKDIYSMEGGIEQWKRCGFPVEKKD